MFLQNFEHATPQLYSGKAKLKKQRTLEKVRSKIDLPSAQKADNEQIEGRVITELKNILVCNVNLFVDLRLTDV